MTVWILKTVRLLAAIAAIGVVGIFSANRILEKTQSLKSNINLIPEEIKSQHFINSSPAHNQFLAGSPVNIVINFDSQLTSQSSQVHFNDKILKTTANLDNRTIRITLSTNSFEEGIYKVSYQACFEDGSCEEGQFAYHLDSHNITRFVNYAARNLVEINLTGESTPPNILVNYQARIRWHNSTQGSIEIKSDPPTFNNHYPSLNSGEVKKGESYEYQFNDPGEYFWHLKSNPQIRGRILVQLGR